MRRTCGSTAVQRSHAALCTSASDIDAGVTLAAPHERLCDTETEYLIHFAAFKQPLRSRRLCGSPHNRAAALGTRQRRHRTAASSSCSPSQPLSRSKSLPSRCRSSITASRGQTRCVVYRGSTNCRSLSFLMPGRTSTRRFVTITAQTVKMALSALREHDYALRLWSTH